MFFSYFFFSGVCYSTTGSTMRQSHPLKMCRATFSAYITSSWSILSRLTPVEACTKHEIGLYCSSQSVNDFAVYSFSSLILFFFIVFKGAGQLSSQETFLLLLKSQFGPTVDPLVTLRITLLKSLAIFYFPYWQICSRRKLLFVIFFFVRSTLIWFWWLWFLIFSLYFSFAEQKLSSCQLLFRKKQTFSSFPVTSNFIYPCLQQYLHAVAL